MQGIVLDLSPNQIYLEIDKQIRFRSSWTAPKEAAPVHVSDRVDFALSVDHGHPFVIIRSVLPVFKTRRNRREH